MGIEYEMFVKRLGVAQATQFVRFYDEAVPYVEGRMKTLGIDCDYNPSGVLRAGIHLSQEKRLRQNMALGQKLGAKTRFVDSSKCGRGNSAGLSFRRRAVWWHVESWEVCRRSAPCGYRGGVKFYERTPLLSFSEGSSIVCKTAHGSATAPVMVLAANAYLPS